ncbi:MAG: hypothetical protein GY800_11130 [Planctomycetes bacterium]|nr:hypothetical protein [Planctomycetota bacterium]
MKNKNGVELNAPKNRERRTTIKKIAVGVGALAGISALPEKWTRPVVESIVLPAHAQTSANLTICSDVTLTLLSGTQSSGTVSVQVQGCVTPATGGVNVLLAVLGSQTAAGTTFHHQQEGLLEQALAAAGDLLVGEAVAADCTEMSGTAVTSAGGTFSADFDISCGPGIKSVSAEAQLSSSAAGTAQGYGVVSIPAESVETPLEPISPCTVGIRNLLPEDITLLHEGTEYILSQGSHFPELIVYFEPFSLTFQSATTDKKVLGDVNAGTTVTFTEEITVDDAVCSGRYIIGTS